MLLIPASLALLKDWTFPRGLFLVVPPKMLSCSSSSCSFVGHDYHSPFLPSAALLWAAPYPTLSLWQEEQCTAPGEVGEKGTESTSHFYHLPIARAWQPWTAGQRHSRDTMGLHFAEQRHWAGHKTSITESAPSNWFFFASAFIKNHYIILSVHFSHYFCANRQMTMLIICCSEKLFTGR